MKFQWLLPEIISMVCTRNASAGAHFGKTTETKNANDRTTLGEPYMFTVTVTTRKLSLPRTRKCFYIITCNVNNDVIVLY